MGLYRRILDIFPSNIVYSFAYGSGVKKQIGYENISKSSNLIDFVLCVKNPLEWHKRNLEINRSHYSALNIFGSKFITKVQEDYGANIYCNTLVPLDKEGVVIKYGVISKEDLITDLVDWTNLYIAGRLHKPVEVVQIIDGDDIVKAIEKNYQNAFFTALLLLPEKFTQFELFYTIANLSYSGDFRMIFGEKKDKVKNIVTAQLDDFYELYLPTIRSAIEYVAFTKDSNKTFEQDKSPIWIERHLQHLPKSLQNNIIFNSHIKYGTEDIFHKIATQTDYKHLISKSVKQIVWRSSVYQSIKNIPTAGLVKSMQYSWKKALKTFNL